MRPKTSWLRVGVAFVPILFVSSASGMATPGRGESLTALLGAPCVAFTARETAERESTGPSASQTGEQSPISKEDLEPMTEDEVRDLIRALAPVESKGQGRTLRALIEPTQLSANRLRVLVGDVTSLMAHVHAREMLGRIADSPGMTGEGLAFAKLAFGAMQGCAPKRFEGRGGDTVFQESLRLFESHRLELEPLILEASRLGALSLLGSGRFP